MRRCQSCVIGVLLLLLASCADYGQGTLDTAKKTAADQDAKEQREREQATQAREKLAAELRQREQLKKDFDMLLGHWEREAGKDAEGRPLASLQLEITATSLARFSFVVGSVRSANECTIRLTSDGEQRFLVQDGSAAGLKLSPLTYRFDGDSLLLQGSAHDVILQEIDLSGTWRRTDWTKKSEAEIADVLKKLGAYLIYDENNPANPIVKVAFNFQSPFSNAQLRVLAGLKQLQELDLSTTNVTDEGLIQLASLKQLKQVTLTSLPVTTEAVHELKKNLPNCTIVR